jgi:hypothetical protein
MLGVNVREPMVRGEAALGSVGLPMGAAKAVVPIKREEPEKAITCVPMVMGAAF